MKPLNPLSRRAEVEELPRTLSEVNARRACRVLGRLPLVQRHTARVRDDEAPLTGRIFELASLYGRYGSPWITAMLRNEGWNVNHKRLPLQLVVVAEWTRERLAIDVARQRGSDDVLERI